jgi:signal transduction histidine kinase
MGNRSLFFQRTLGTPFRRYVVAIASVAVAFLLSSALHPLVGDGLGYVLIFPAVAFSAWYCGMGPSIVATILAVIGTTYGFVPPIQPLRILGAGALVRASVFLASSALVVLMGESRRRHNEKLRNEQGELEKRVRERTTDLDTANKSLRELSARLLQLQDDERRRIARELHDSVGQMLVALTMNLSAVRLDVERLSKIAHALTDSENLVQEMSSEVRTISHLLHPPLLDEAGLLSALRWYVEGFVRRSKIEVDLDFPVILAAFRANRKRPFSASCKSVSPTFTATPEVQWPGFAFASAIATCWWISRTKAKAFLRKKSRRWHPPAHPASAFAACGKDSVNSEARSKCTRAETAPSFMCACPSPMHR